MNLLSLKTLPKAFFDALNLLFTTNAAVYTGLAPTAHGVASLQVDVAAGTYFKAGSFTSVSYGGGNVVLSGPDPTNPRYDIIYLSNTNVLTAGAGTPASSNPVAPAWPANSCPIATAFVPANAVDLLNSGAANSGFIQDLREFWPNHAATHNSGGTDVMASATATVSGLVPTPPNNTTTFFRGDATFASPPAATSTVTGYVPTPPNDVTQVLRGDATWGVPPPTEPNQVVNSDFGRRSVFGLAMPEVFADTSAWTGGSLSVASNQLTQATASVWSKWTGPNSMWRDGRWSVQWKANTAGAGLIAKYVDANDALTTGNAVIVQVDATTFYLRKIIAGTLTNIATVGVTPVNGQWYWLELDAQGTTYTAKLWSSGASPVVKTSATLLQTLSGTIADAGVVSGGIAMWSNQASSVWGGIGTGNGGAYVETFLPESWGLSFTGTLGGQALGFDETADSGPLTKQWAVRAYIPATSRALNLRQDAPDGSIQASTAYTASFYEKVSGLGGTGALITAKMIGRTSALADVTTISLSDAGEAAYTRKTGTATMGATVRRATTFLSVNDGVTASGTVWFSLPQFEQGSVATGWREAPSDTSAPLVVELEYSIATNLTTTSASFVEVSSRDLGANFFLPWNADVVFEFEASANNNVVSINNQFAINVDGAPGVSGAEMVTSPAASAWFTVRASKRIQNMTAGKHRATAVMATGGNTLSIISASVSINANPLLRITAYRR